MDDSLSSEEQSQKNLGLSPLDSLSLPKSLLIVVNWLSRRRHATFAAIEKGTKQKREQIESALESLKASGYIHEELIDDVPHYRIVYGGKASRSARGLSDDIWSKVDLDE